MAKDPKKNEKSEQKNNFIKEVRMELKKVTWPTRKELITSTGTVLFITIFIALIVFFLDFGFEKINTYGVEKLKDVVSSSASEEQIPDNAVLNGEENSGEHSAETTENTVVDNTTTENKTEENTESEENKEENKTEEAAQ